MKRRTKYKKRVSFLCCGVCLFCCFFIFTGFIKKEERQRVFDMELVAANPNVKPDDRTFEEETQEKEEEIQEGEEDAASESDFSGLLMPAIVSFIGAGFMTWGAVAQHKSRMTAGCTTYQKEVRINPATKRDQYIRTVTTASRKSGKK